MNIRTMTSSLLCLGLLLALSLPAWAQPGGPGQRGKPGGPRVPAGQHHVAECPVEKPIHFRTRCRCPQKTKRVRISKSSTQCVPTDDGQGDTAQGDTAKTCPLETELLPSFKCTCPQAHKRLPLYRKPNSPTWCAPDKKLKVCPANTVILAAHRCTCPNGTKRMSPAKGKIKCVSTRHSLRNSSQNGRASGRRSPGPAPGR